MDGPGRTTNPACAQSHRTQAGTGLGLKKSSAEFKSYHGFCYYRTQAQIALNGQLEKSAQKHKCSSKPTASHMTF